MAMLRNLRTNRVRPVPARMLVGRAPACSLRLDDPHVSGEHASLIWKGDRWEIRDLGSRNGTFVDGDRLEPGSPVELDEGGRLDFGHDEDPWVLEKAGAPTALAEAVGDDRVRTGDGDLLALPDADSPEVVVYRRRGQWVAETDEGEARPVEDQQVVQAGGQSWRIRLPASQAGTAAVDSGPSVDNISLRFAVSRDEEHVQITVLHRQREIELEPREHGYTLLTLARQRLEDAELPASEQGWLDRDLLLQMLGVDANALNVAIYRARGQMGDAGIDHAAGVVEVRRGQRRIGLPPDRLEVVPL